MVFAWLVIGLAGCAANEPATADPVQEQTQESAEEVTESEEAEVVEPEPEEADSEEAEEVEASEEAEEPEESEESEESAPEPVLEQAATALVGTWLWMGTPYYVLEADGQGTMASLDINWTANDGVLAICNTPALCGGNCSLPAEWYYEIDGNELNLTSTIIPDMSYTYTRQ